MVHHQAGEADAAVGLGRRGLATARRCDDDATVVLAFLLLAPLARVVKGATAELPDAAEMVERARRARQTKLLSVLLPMAATEALLSGEVVAARRWWPEGLRLARTLPTSPVAGHNLPASVVMARAFRSPHEAAQLHGRPVAALDALAGDMPPEHRQGYEVQVRKLERDLGSEVFARELALGQSLPWTAGLALAIATAEAV